MLGASAAPGEVAYSKRLGGGRLGYCFGSALLDHLVPDLGSSVPETGGNFRPLFSAPLPHGDLDRGEHGLSGSPARPPPEAAG